MPTDSCCHDLLLRPGGLWIVMPLEVPFLYRIVFAMYFF